MENTRNRKIYAVSSDPKICAQCPTRQLCTRSKTFQKAVTRHIWKDYEELADDARYTPQYRDLYAKRKETIERVFADAKEKHAMRYTQYRGLAQVSKWVRLKFVAMNLKKPALWKWRKPTPAHAPLLFFCPFFLMLENWAYTGLVHHVEVTSANIHDVTVVPKLLTGEENVVYGDSGYLGAEKRKDAVIRNTQGRKIRYKTSHRPSQFKNHSVRSRAQIKRREREKSSVRAKVEHVFGVVKGLWGYRKTRYRGLLKQTAKLNMMFALANLYLANKLLAFSIIGRYFLKEINGLWHERCGDYHLSCLVLPEQKSVGKWGQKYRAYLRKHKHEVYSAFQSKDTLDEHIAEIDQQAEKMFERLLEQIAMRQDITELLKADDQMAWVSAMNHVRSIVEEIVLSDLIYC